MKKPFGFLSGLLRVTGALGLAISSSPARNVRPDYQLPVQNYAVIDLSGAAVGGNDATNIALDDDNKASFICYQTASGSNLDEYIVYTWSPASGLLQQVQTLPTGKTVGGGDGDKERRDYAYGYNCLTIDGDVYGQEKVIRYINAEGKWNYDGLDASPGITAGNSSVSELNPFSPPYVKVSMGDGLPANYSSSFSVWSVSPFSYCGPVNEQYLTPLPNQITKPTSEVSGVVVAGGITYVFDPAYPDDLSGIAIPNNMVISSQKFWPFQCNKYGWAIGTDNSHFNLYWNPGSASVGSIGSDNDYVIDINDQNQIVMQEAAPGEGYLWDTAGSPKPFIDVLATLVQGQCNNIQPYSISNQVDAEDEDSDATIHILSTASDNGATDEMLFVRDDDGNWTYHKIQLPAGVTITDWNTINSSGIIAALGTITTTDVSGHSTASAQKALLLLPIGINDEQDPTKPKVIQSLPKQGNDESDNDYLQQQLPDSCIAYITGSNAPPKMPHLVAKGVSGVKLKWRLEVDYQRFNGWTSDYAYAGVWYREDKQWHQLAFHIDEDLVHIPIITSGTAPVFTDEVDGDWRIFESPDWDKEINGDPAHNIPGKGFFGGTAKLYVWPPGQETAPTEPVMTFRIGGQNPDPAYAKSFIQGDLCDSRLWFAYAIAKKESAGLDQPYYNQFFGLTRPPSRLDKNGNQVYASGYNEDKDGQCWAQGWPAFNIDRLTHSNGPLNSAGGYGIFQNTGDAQSQWSAIPRRQIWNWQDNVGYQEANVWKGAMGILKAKIKIVDDRYTKLQQTYTGCGTIGNYPQNPSPANNHKLFSGWDAYTCKAYNGFGGTAPKVEITGFTKPQFSVWHAKGTHWKYIDDGYTLDTHLKIKRELGFFGVGRRGLH